jgi:hypothetical protein
VARRCGKQGSGSPAPKRPARPSPQYDGNEYAALPVVAVLYCCAMRFDVRLLKDLRSRVRVLRSLEYGPNSSAFPSCGVAAFWSSRRDGSQSPVGPEDQFQGVVVRDHPVTAAFHAFLPDSGVRMPLCDNSVHAESHAWSCIETLHRPPSPDQPKRLDHNTAEPVDMLFSVRALPVAKQYIAPSSRRNAARPACPLPTSASNCHQLPGAIHHRKPALQRRGTDALFELQAWLD